MKTDPLRRSLNRFWTLSASSLARGVCSLTFGILAISPALAAPFPQDGLPTRWTQPDGTILKLRVFGDEFYGRTTTEEGYTVVFNPADKTYYYAMTGADGKSLAPSGIKADRVAPQQLAKHLKEAKEIVAAAREAKIEKFTPDRAANWAAKVKAAQARRDREAGLAPAPGDGNGPAPAPGDGPLAAPISGAKVGLVILVQFPDDPATGGVDPTSFPVTQSKINRLCNEVGYADDASSGSIRDYFTDQSNGQLTHTQVVSPIVTLAHPRNYYNYSDYPTNLTLADNGAVGRQMVTEAITKLKTDGFDFSTLSVDANNRVYATSLLFAGNDSGVWPKGLWPHAWVLSGNGINVGTVAAPRYIYGYQETNVANSAPVIGTVCHELGHLLLGYPDLYDYDGDSEGVGEHSLMGSGNHLNNGKTPGPIDLYLKDTSGWANITDLTPTQSLDVTLPTTGNRGYRIRKPGTTTEYFLVENRGAGDKWATFSPDKGIMIWHIDETVSGNNFQQRTPTQHYEVSVEQADGLFQLENNQNRGDTNDLFDSTTGLFNNGTNPDANWWGGTASGISISVLSAPGASMNVRFGAGTPATTLTLNPSTQSVVSGGASPSFAVTSNTAWSWSGGAAWVTISEAVNQTGDQTFSYTVAANTSAATRSATITLTAGALVRTHTITQDGLVADDHGNSTATATVVGQNSTTSGIIEVPGDNDYFRINVVGAGTLQVETTGATDTFGYLLDSAGGELITDDDTGDATNFRISYAVTTGTYYVRVKHFYLEQAGGYQFVSSFAATPTLTVNPTTRSVIAGGSTSTFSVASNITWSWTADQPWLTTSEVVTQSGDQTFTYSTSANVGTSPRTATFTLTGGGLTQTHVVTQAGAPADDHGNNIATATVVGQASTTNGNLETAGDNDYFRINVGGIGTLLVQSTGATDTYGYLLDAAGAPLTEDDDAGASNNFLISYAVTAGTYYVRVRHYDPTGTGAYQVVSSFTSSPTLTVDPTTQAVVAGGGTFDFTVSSNTAWSWSSNAAWLTSGEAASQTGNQTFTYSVAANAAATSRTGVITLTAGALTATLTVTQDPTALPDLVDPGSYYFVTSATLAPGEALTIGGDVRNQGNAASGAYVVKFYLSTDTTISASDIYLGEKAMAALGASSSGVIDQSGLIVPLPTPPGTYYAGWIYDQANTVVESNEGNNTGYVPSQTVTIGGNTIKIITQTLGDGSASSWGGLLGGSPNLMDEASLTTAANGLSDDAFDGVGTLTLSPAITLPPLSAPSSAGPLSATATTGSVTVTREIRLVGGRHATDEQITLTNVSGASQPITLEINDNYGSDTATQVHGTSSGDTTVTTADNWFVSSDQTLPGATSVDPSLMVSWRFSSNLPAPAFPTVPGAGGDAFNINFGTFSLAAGQSVSVTIRRELFDSAALALANGRSINSVTAITQTLGDTSQSVWGNENSTYNYVEEATLTTPANGISGDAFDGMGILTVGPSLAFPALVAQNTAGPLVSTATSGSVNATHTVSLVSGRHATDEVITLANVSGVVQGATLRIDDNYGSDGATQVHGTSSGDTTVTTADNWFVISDQSSPAAISGDPAVIVSWKFSGGLSTPALPKVPSAGVDSFALDFGSFNLAAGQTVTVTIRRELFDSAALALASVGGTYTGTTAGKPTWNRPVANGMNPPTGLSGTGTAVPYEAVGFTVGTAGIYTLTSTATVPAGWDNYLFLYANSLNPAAPLSNVMIGNDDFPDAGISGFSISLSPGTTYFAVTTGFANSNSGAYYLQIGGAGTVSITPPGGQSPIESWRQAWYGTTANTGNAADNADPYHTGVPNLVVFAILGPNQNPALVRGNQLPSAQMIGGNIVLSFTQPAGVSGITYGAQRSPTMAPASWVPITDSVNGSLHVFSVPVGSDPKMFIRLSVSNP